MKKYYLNALWGALLLTLISFSSAKADFIIQGGLSTPNNKMGDVYNGKYDNFSEKANSGYFLGAKLRIPLINDFNFYVGAAYNHFPETELKISYNNQTYSLSSSQNIAPISAGINYYLFKNVFGFYLLGEASYNYIYSSIDAKQGDLTIPISKSATDNRVGYGIGLGSDLDIKIIGLNIEAKYNVPNQIGKVSGEKNKPYFNLGIGIIF